MTHGPINTGIKFDLGQRQGGDEVVTETCFILETTNGDFYIARQMPDAQAEHGKKRKHKPQAAPQFEITPSHYDAPYGKTTVQYLDGDLNGDTLVQEHMIVTRKKGYYHIEVSFGLNDGEDKTMTEARALEIAHSLGFDCVEPRMNLDVEDNIYWAEIDIPIPVDKAEAKQKKTSAGTAQR
jgi:hypothetical protein